MINLITKHGDRETLLQKIGEGVWEFDGMSFDDRMLESGGKRIERFDDDSLELNVPYPSLGKEGLSDLIENLERLMQEKPEYQEGSSDFDIGWLTNEGKIRMKGYFIPNGSIGFGKDQKVGVPMYKIHIGAQNKFRKKFHPISPDDHDYFPGFHDLEGYRGKGIFTTPENLKKYISELKAELKNA